MGVTHTYRYIKVPAKPSGKAITTFQYTLTGVGDTIQGCICDYNGETITTYRSQLYVTTELGEFGYSNYTFTFKPSKKIRYYINNEDKGIKNAGTAFNLFGYNVDSIFVAIQE